MSPCWALAPKLNLVSPVTNRSSAFLSVTLFALFKVLQFISHSGTLSPPKKMKN